LPKGRAKAIGLMGDSAGGQLAALLALAGDQFTSAYHDDANAAAAVQVKAVVGFYGIYDLLAPWKHDRLAQQHRELLAQRNQDLIRTPPAASQKNSSAPPRRRTSRSIRRRLQ
jgi:acetyl esterase/lipase